MTILPASPSRGGRGRWIAVGLIGLSVGTAVAYGALGIVAATQAMDRARSAIKTTLDHQKTVSVVLNAKPFEKIGLTSNLVDFAGVRTTLDGFEATLAPALALDRADEAKLRTARRELNGSFLTLPERGVLLDAERRVDAALAGMASADQQLVWIQQEVAYIRPVLDAGDEWMLLTTAADAEDVVGVMAQIEAIANSLQKAATLAKPPALAPTAIARVQLMQKQLADVRDLLEAIQSGDQGGINQYTAALVADRTALSKDNSAAYKEYRRALFGPLTKQYDDDMKRAASGS